jgi:hypothetical protein
MSRRNDPDAGEWRSVAEELAAALQTTVLRNPKVSAEDWARAHAALERYEGAGGAPAPSEEPASPGVEPVGAAGEAG